MNTVIGLIHFQLPKLQNLKIGPGQKAFDVNVLTIITFRDLGCGFYAIETFFQCMNMSPPMNQSSYDKTVTYLYPCYKASANDSMLQAANEAHKNTEGVVANVTASFDGS